MTRLSSAVIISATLILPFIFTYQTLDPVLLPRFILLAAVTLLLMVILAVHRWRHPESADSDILSRAVFIAALAYIAFSVLSLTQTANLGESLYELSRTVTLFVFLGVAAMTLARNPSLGLHLSRAITIVALILSLIGLAQYFNVAFMSLPGNIVPYGTMANKNLLASAVFLCLPFIFYAQTQTTRFWSACAWAALVIALMLVVISQTRAVWLAFAAATGMTAFLLAALRSRLRDSGGITSVRAMTMRAAGFVLMVVVVVGVVWLAAGRDLALWERATSIVSMDDRSVQDRIGIWGNSISMFADHPLLGVGPGEWRTHVSGYGNQGLRSEMGVIHFQRPHNDYLWVLTEIGLLGLIAYLLIFVSALVYAVRLIRTASDRRQTWQVVALLYGLIGYMVVAFFSYPKERITHSVLLILVLAILTAAYHRTRPVRRRLAGGMFAIVSVAAIGILMLGLVAGFSRVSAERHLGRAYRYREVGQWERVIDEIDKARTFFMTMDPMSTPLPWYRGVAQFSLQRYEAALVDFQRAYRVNPTHLHVLNNLATAYEVHGRHADAIELYEKALEISPNLDETLLNLAAVYYNTGEYEKAFDRISRVSGDCMDERYHTFLNRIRQRLDVSSGDE